MSASVHAGIHPPPSRHSTGADSPEQTPPQSRHPPRADTPQEQTVHAGRYGQQLGGMHPTGMHTCYTCLSVILFTKGKGSLYGVTSCLAAWSFGRVSVFVPCSFWRVICLWYHVPSRGSLGGSLPDRHPGQSPPRETPPRPRTSWTENLLDRDPLCTVKNGRYASYCKVFLIFDFIFFLLAHRGKIFWA